MIAIISILMPPIIMGYLREKLIKRYDKSLWRILGYGFSIVALNLAVALIVQYIFGSKGNVFLKLTQYSNYAIKYFVLSTFLAIIEPVAEMTIRKKRTVGEIWGGNGIPEFSCLKKGILEFWKSKRELFVEVIYSPELWIKKYLNQITRKDGYIFKSVFMVALLVHIFVLTNNLANYDSMWFFYSSQDVVTSGRWFLKYAGGISSYFHLQWLNGALSLLYVSLSAVIVCRYLEIHNKYLGILAGVVLAIYPTVARTFNFMYAADAYFLAILLAVVAAWLMCKDKWNFKLLGGILLGFSMGIYQAYLSVTLVLLLLWTIKRTLLRRESITKYIGGIIMGLLSAAGVYVIGLEYRLDGRELTSYQGISDSTLIHPLHWYFKRFFDSFKDIIHLFVTDAYENKYALIAITIIWSVIILFVICRMVSLLRNKMVTCAIWGGLAILLIPMAVYCLRLLSDGVNYYGLMVESIAFVWILPIMILDESISVSRKGRRNKAVLAAMVICYLVNLWNYVIVDNISYLASSIAYEKSYALSERIVDRMEQTEGYENMEYVYFYGDVETEKYEDVRFQNKSVNGNKIIPYANIPYTYFINIYIGGNYEVLNNAQRMSEIQESLEFQNMPVWPTAGCTKMIGKVMVVKLGDE